MWCDAMCGCSVSSLNRWLLALWTLRTSRLLSHSVTLTATLSVDGTKAPIQKQTENRIYEFSICFLPHVQITETRSFIFIDMLRFIKVSSMVSSSSFVSARRCPFLIKFKENEKKRTNERKRIKITVIIIIKLLSLGFINSTFSMPTLCRCFSFIHTLWIVRVFV